MGYGLLSAVGLFAGTTEELGQTRVAPAAEPGHPTPQLANYTIRVIHTSQSAGSVAGQVARPLDAVTPPWVKYHNLPPPPPRPL